MPQPQFGRVAVLGLGLMGSSLGLALRSRGLAEEVAGCDRAAEVALAARARGTIDTAYADAPAAVRGAELVVLAVPVLSMRELLRGIASSLDAGALVTDLGSTKLAVQTWAGEVLAPANAFVGGHPMRGSEHSGPAGADGDLFAGCTWCLTATPTTDPAAVRRVIALVDALGARPLLLDAAPHDAAAALISHLPMLAAGALTMTAASAPEWPIAQCMAGRGFRDSTRVASHDPRMVRDICLTNAGPLLAGLDAYIARLRALRALVATEDTTIEEQCATAKATRDGWLAAREDA